MKVGLFIPCYINAVYPEVGIASYKLLRHVGVDVDYPMDQTCCGQPMANAGFEDEAARLALRMEEQFKNYDYVVGPSASCVAFVKENHPHILEKRDHVCMNSKKIYDICEFLHDVVRPGSLPAVFPHKVSIHNSCHGVRELHLSSPSERNIPYYSKLRDPPFLGERYRGVRAEAGGRMLRFRRYVRPSRSLSLYLHGTRQGKGSYEYRAPSISPVRIALA